jgi:hypothetical protein
MWGLLRKPTIPALKEGGEAPSPWLGAWEGKKHRRPCRRFFPVKGGLHDARKKMRTQKPAYSKIVLTALDARIKQHSAILAGLQGGAGGQTIYAIPVDQVFRWAQTNRKTIQAIGNAKSDTLAAIRRLASDITGGTNG